MYVPPAFLVSDPSTLHAFIEAHNFGTLISQRKGAPYGTHLPFLLERNAGTQGSLLGHVARANAHWQDSESSALALFTGPHAYISPTWYEAAQTVPTWTYVAVHVYGTLEWLQDPADILSILTRTVEIHERTMPVPWSIPQNEFVSRLATQVVGFRMPIERLEGNWKLNQHHPPERREKVVRALEAQADPNAAAIAALMRSK